MPNTSLPPEINTHCDAPITCPTVFLACERRVGKRLTNVFDKQIVIHLIDIADAGDAGNLRRLLAEHVRASDDETWEKVWRV